MSTAGNDIDEAAAPVPRGGALTSLVLTDFRNYGYLSVKVGPEPIVLTGANGAGKTNILEAVSLLAPGRGLRRARRQLPRTG